MPIIKFNCDNISEGKSLQVFFKFKFWKVKGILKVLNFFLFLNDMKNVVLGLVKKTNCPQKYCHISIL